MCVQTDLYIAPRQQKCPVLWCKNVNTGKFHFSNKTNFCQLIRKRDMESCSLLSMLLDSPRMFWAGLVFVQRANDLISPSAVQECRRNREIVKNRWLGFWILPASSATIPYLVLVFPCSSHACSLDSENVELHKLL